MILQRAPHDVEDRCCWELFFRILFEVHVVTVEEIAGHPSKVDRQTLQLHHVLPLLQSLGHRTTVENNVDNVLAVLRRQPEPVDHRLPITSKFIE